ncbi:MAG TPA: hypothetical protein DF774_11430 [Rheinheimera sp.]|uniref:hypothetical protein n=1 Tax=Rheinheimera sp. TaxID=1869214 RepID=UPI000EEA93E0|nr:hypothetical protein [Rheinheimera sp.]HCU66358.1 hypothetical protein [Rheinheimera sp.]
MKFTCVITGAQVARLEVWQRDLAMDAIPIKSGSVLRLILNLSDEHGEAGYCPIDVCVEQSRIVPIRSAVELPYTEFILETIEADYLPTEGWWLDENSGWLVCPSAGNIPSVIFYVLVRFNEYEIKNLSFVV